MYPGNEELIEKCHERLWLGLDCGLQWYSASDYAWIDVDVNIDGMPNLEIWTKWGPDRLRIRPDDDSTHFNIGKLRMPHPTKVPPTKGTKYYTICSDYVTELIWRDDNYDYEHLRLGNVFLLDQYAHTWHKFQSKLRNGDIRTISKITTDITNYDDQLNKENLDEQELLQAKKITLKTVEKLQTENYELREVIKNQQIELFEVTEKVEMVVPNLVDLTNEPIGHKRSFLLNIYKQNEELFQSRGINLPQVLIELESIE